MSVVSPQLFPVSFSHDMTPTDIYTYDKAEPLFYIPDCQRESFEEFVKINKLASLFFTDHFAHCLKPDGRINFEQVREWYGIEDLPSITDGRIPSALFKSIHVISFSQLEKFKKEGARCPWCSKSVRELTTCPLWEIKLRYPDRDIDWTREQLNPSTEVTIVRRRSNSDSRDFSLIHLIFLIDFAANDTSPWEQPPSEGIIERFMQCDPQYAQNVLSTIRHELNEIKTEAWVRHLHLRTDLGVLKNQLNEYLRECPPSHYQEPRAFTEDVLQRYPDVETLEDVKDSCELLSTPIDPIHRPVTPWRQLSNTSIKEESCMPLRYLLLGTIFICSFLYFFSTLMVAFFKGRFFFGDEL
ncbi:MAG: hypothetical protein KDK56_06715 [Simkania sp.]|nr:hypothetical protein [Simkania sp.]